MAATTYTTAFVCDAKPYDTGLEQGGENKVDTEVDDAILNPLYVLAGSINLGCLTKHSNNMP
jgi:hypothetical protein